MYTITRSTPFTTGTPMYFPERRSAMTVLDIIKEHALSVGNDVNYSSCLGKDVRLTVGEDITYILKG